MKHPLCWRYDRVNGLEPGNCLLSKDEGQTFLHIKHTDGTTLPAMFDNPAMALMYLNSVSDTSDIPDIEDYRPVYPKALIFTGVVPEYHRLRLLIATCPHCGRPIMELTDMLFKCDVCGSTVKLPVPAVNRKGAD